MYDLNNFPNTNSSIYTAKYSISKLLKIDNYLVIHCNNHLEVTLI